MKNLAHRLSLFALAIPCFGKFLREPSRPQYFGLSSYAVEQWGSRRWRSLRCGSEWFDVKVIESGEYWCHRGVGVAEEDAAADANENPAEAFEDGLAFEIVLELFRRVPLFAVALDGEALRESFDNEIDPASADGPLRLHAVACAYESLQNQLLENGVGSFALFQIGRAHV